MCDPDPSITLTWKSKPRRVAFKTLVFWNIFCRHMPVTHSPEHSSLEFLALQPPPHAVRGEVRSSATPQVRGHPVLKTLKAGAHSLQPKLWVAGRGLARRGGGG